MEAYATTERLRVGDDALGGRSGEGRMRRRDETRPEGQYTNLIGGQCGATEDVYGGVGDRSGVLLPTGNRSVEGRQRVAVDQPATTAVRDYVSL